jgi:hypothetical protein
MSRQELVKSFTKEVLMDVSAVESIAVDSFDPGNFNNGDTSRGPLGIGLDVPVIGLLLPFIYKYFEKLFDKIVDKGADLSTELILEYIKKNFFCQPQESLVISVKKELQEAGVPDEKLDSVAATIIKTLDKKVAILKEKQ